MVEKIQSESNINKELDDSFKDLMDWYAFDSNTFNDGRKLGFQEGIITHSIGQFFRTYDLKRAAECAELFIRQFNEKFSSCSILQARIGINPSSMEPTAFFVTNAPEDIFVPVMKLQRKVEADFLRQNAGHPICIWSVSGNVCQDTVRADYPFIRKAVTKNA